ncbi:MAG TPA: cytochrome b/b6 domain-containing protein [Steroidobacteraceae bacterium]|nr:cytochrome b/b6 domain-containing protein [Steroidobacteraceae bacterium]
MPARADVKVWDPVVRTTHWLLVFGVVSAWLTRHAAGSWHEWLGYGALAVIAIRFVWGLRGPPHARFAQFIRSPTETLRYARQVLAGHEPRYLGHNPLGGWMIVALLLDVALVGASGWLYTTDAFWGVEWVERVHSLLADSLLVLAALHVSGVVFSSWRHRENLLIAMLHGRKRAPEQRPDLAGD